MTTFIEVRNAVDEAKLTLAAADSVASAMAHLLVGRLRKVPSWVLADLKRELRDYNIKTCEWKEQK